MHYQEAISYLFGLERFGWQLGLERMQAMLAELGNPHRYFRSIHVAGTNGKGSVCAMLASILSASGYKTGLYTSPHLIKAEERIRINGAEIAEADVIALIAELQPLFDRHRCTFFEAVTALAFVYFQRQRIDWAVVEVGLGGRLDATNVLQPELCMITHIDYDHTDHLGTTLAQIAGEKAGIIKAGVPCVVGKLPAAAIQVINQKGEVVFARKECRVRDLKMTAEGSFFVLATAERNLGIRLPLPGPHQVLNSCVAIQGCRVLGLSESAMVQGLQRVSWPGRFQLLHDRPLIILDVAHNSSGFNRLKWMIDHFYPEKKVHLVIGVLKDKDYHRMMQILPKRLHAIYAVTPAGSRALPAAELAIPAKPIYFQEFSGVAEGLGVAFKRALPEELICIAGSHYLAAEAFQVIKTLTK